MYTFTNRDKESSDTYRETAAGEKRRRHFTSPFNKNRVKKEQGFVWGTQLQIVWNMCNIKHKAR